MGVVSVFGMFASLAFLVVAIVKINRLRREEPDEDVAWGLKVAVAAGVTILVGSILGITNNYFHKIDTPFAPGQAELADKPEPVKDPEPVKIKAPEKRDLVKGAKDEHRKALDDFEQSSSRLEQK